MPRPPKLPIKPEDEEPALRKLETEAPWYALLSRRAGDMAIILLARGLLGLACAGIGGFGVWYTFWNSVSGAASTDQQFIGTLALVVGIPSGLATALLWRNGESPRRVRRTFAAIALLTAIVAPFVAGHIQGVHTYYGLFGGVLRLPVIAVSESLMTMLVASAVAANVVSAALMTYRMARYGEM